MCRSYLSIIRPLCTINHYKSATFLCIQFWLVHFQKVLLDAVADSLLTIFLTLLLCVFNSAAYHSLINRYSCFIIYLLTGSLLSILLLVIPSTSILVV